MERFWVGMFLLIGTILITLLFVWLQVWQERTFNKKGDQ
jgi:ABC-type transporter Mla subunit MlaD